MSGARSGGWKRAAVALSGVSALTGALLPGCTANRAKYVPPTDTATATWTFSATPTLSPTWYPSFSPSLTWTATFTFTPFVPPAPTCAFSSCTFTQTSPATLTFTRTRTPSRTLTPTPTPTVPGGGAPTLTPWVLYDEPFCPNQPFLWGITGSSGGALAAFDDSHVAPTCTCSPEAHSGIFSIAVWSNGAHYTLSVPPTLTGTLTPEPTPTFTPESWEAGYLFHCAILGTPCPGTLSPTATGTLSPSPTACSAFATGPGIGRDVTGYSKLTLWARGILGGEQVTFGFGFGNDSAQNQISVVLTQAFQKVTVPVVAGTDMSHVAALFWWRSSVPAPQTFYLDRIEYTND